jgi:hypothetical protein
MLVRRPWEEMIRPGTGTCNTQQKENKDDKEKQKTRGTVIHGDVVDSHNDAQRLQQRQYGINDNRGSCHNKRGCFNNR